MPSRRWSISNAAVLLTGLTLVSTLLGFVRDVVIGAVFGASAALDAYLAAQGLMNIVVAFAARAMARSVVPRTAREVGEEGDSSCRGHPGFDTALTVTLAAMGVISLVMAVFAAPVTAVIAPGFEGEQALLTAGLTRILLLATILVAGTNLLAALSQAHGRFGWSGLEGVPFNLVMIAAAGVFGARYGVMALALGYVLGSLARLLIQLPPLRAARVRIRPRWNLREPGFREIIAIMPSMLVGSAIANVNTMVDRAVGSTLDVGAITSLSYAWRLVNLPENLLVASLLVPLYPALSSVAANRAEVRRLTTRGLSVIVTALVPLCIALSLAAGPAVQVVFGHGAFDASAVARTSEAVLWYAPAMIALGWRQLIVRASYAVGDSRTPVTVALVAMLVNIVGDITLAPLMGVAGIALATTASLSLAAVLNTWLLRSKHDGVAARPVAALAGRAVLVGLFALAAGFGVRALTADLPALVGVVLVGGSVLGVYALGLLTLRAPEAAMTREMLGRVLRRRRPARGD